MVTHRLLGRPQMVLWSNAVDHRHGMCTTTGTSSMAFPQQVHSVESLGAPKEGCSRRLKVSSVELCRLNILLPSQCIALALVAGYGLHTPWH
jgi:hypothetical protein